MVCRSLVGFAVDRNYPVVSFEEVQLIIAETAVGTSPDEALIKR